MCSWQTQARVTVCELLPPAKLLQTQPEIAGGTGEAVHLEHKPVLARVDRPDQHAVQDLVVLL